MFEGDIFLGLVAAVSHRHKAIVTLLRETLVARSFSEETATTADFIGYLNSGQIELAQVPLLVSGSPLFFPSTMI